MGVCAVAGVDAVWQALMQKGAEQEERRAACQRCACCVQEGLRRARAESEGRGRQKQKEENRNLKVRGELMQ